VKRAVALIDVCWQICRFVTFCRSIWSAKESVRAFNGRSSMAGNGLVSLRSKVSTHETLERLMNAVANRDLTIFARIDHAAGAAAVALSLRPTEVVIFGNAKGGTTLMQDRQSVGIDLPLKALVWEDADGSAWLAYNDPAWIAGRHSLGTGSVPAVEAMTKLLSAIAQEVTK
jgi:uncharacterized protein (DUF302 family)